MVSIWSALAERFTKRFLASKFESSIFCSTTNRLGIFGLPWSSSFGGFLLMLVRVRQVDRGYPLVFPNKTLGSGISPCFNAGNISSIRDPWNPVSYVSWCQSVLTRPNLLLVGDFNPFEKYDRQNGFIFPKFRGENSKTNLSCHHLV